MERFTTLFEWLDSGSSEAVVGLEQVDYQVHCLNTAYLHFTTKVTEYRSGEAGEKPYYHCKLDECKDEQGNAEQMKTHLFTLRHKQAGRENKSSQISDIANCSKKGPYYRDRVSIGIFWRFGYLIIFQGPRDPVPISSALCVLCFILIPPGC